MWLLIKISHKRHTFICRVKIYALSAVYANLINLIHASKQNACKQTHRQFAAVTPGARCNLKMLSRCYLIYLTKTFGSINKIFGRVKKTIQGPTLVDSSKRVSLTEQKFGRLNQNVLCNQQNTVNQTILLDEPFFSERTIKFSPCSIHCWWIRETLQYIRFNF